MIKQKRFTKYYHRYLLSLLCLSWLGNYNQSANNIAPPHLNNLLFTSEELRGNGQNHQLLNCSGNADAVISASGVGNSANALGAPNSNYAELYQQSDVLVLDLTDVITAGESYDITWRRKSSYSAGPVADLVIEESSDNSTWTENATRPATASQSFITTTLTAGVDTRYLRIQIETDSNDDADIDAISYSGVACNGGSGGGGGSQTCGNATAAQGNTRNGATSNATGDANGSTTEIGATSDYLVLTLGDELPIGTDYTIHISGRGGAATADIFEAPDGTSLPSSQSNNPSGFTQNGTASSGGGGALAQVTKTTNVTTKYLYMDRGSGDIEIDAVTYCTADPCQGINPTITPYVRVNSGSWVNNSTLSLCEGGTFQIGTQVNIQNDIVLTLPDNSTDNTTDGNSFFTFTNASASDAGTYTLTYTDGNGCSATQDYTVTVTAAPTVNVGAVSPTCTGSTVNSDGYVQLSSVSSGDRYHWNTGSTFNTAGKSYANATTLSGSYPLTIASSQSNPTISQDYTMRVYNGSDDCYTDATVTMYQRTCAAACSGDLGGKVFHDFDNDGTQDTNEGGQANIQINVYECDSSTPTATTLSDANGDWSVDDSGITYPVRVEFSLGLTPWLESSIVGTTNRSDVQIISSSSCTVSFGVLDPSLYCENNPRLAISCQVNGDPSFSGASRAGDVDALVSLDYSDGNNKVKDATAGEIGSVWGLAYSKTREELYSAAFLKRHVGMGTSGLGAIYTTEYSQLGTPSSLLIDLAACASIGTISSNSARGLPEIIWGLSGLSFDADAYGKVAKVGLGDIDLSSDYNTLYVTNLNERNIIVVDLTTYNSTGTKPGCAQTSTLSVPHPSCTNGVSRLFGLKVYNGKLYVGLVCTAENGGTSADLQGTVLSYDLTNTNWATELSFPLNYTKGQSQLAFSGCTQFNPWSDDDSDKDGYFCNIFGGRLVDCICYPTPVLSDIEFDSKDGSMIIGIMDRGGHQWGSINENTSSGDDNRLYDYRIGGDVLRAHNNNGTFVLESGGTTMNGGGCGANGQGPGGGEYYCGDEQFDSGGNTVSHEETSMGALLHLPNSGLITVVSMNPNNGTGAGNFNSGGIHWMNNTTGAVARGVELYGGTNSSNGFFGKSNGLGDMELLCSENTINVGNKVWIDTDQDGTQDACESALSGLVVRLYTNPSSGNAQLVSSYTTNSGGGYTFTNLQKGTAYYIVFNGDGYNATTNEVTIGSTTYEFTTANSGEGNNPDLNDSDVTEINIAGLGNVPAISFTTSESNYTFDAGLIPACTPVTPVCEYNINSGGWIANDCTVEVCEGDFLQLAVNPNSLTYAWSGPNGFSGVGGSGGQVTISNNITTAEAGTYTVTITNGNGCTSTQDMTVTVTPKPTFTASAEQPTCTGASVNNNGYLQLTSVTNGVGYHWSVGSTFDDNGGANNSLNATSLSGASYPLQIATGLASPTTTQDYTIRVYNGTDVCYTDVTVTLSTGTIMEVSVPEDSIYYCPGAEVSIPVVAEATTGEVSWQWYNNASLVSHYDISPVTDTLPFKPLVELHAYNLPTGQLETWENAGSLGGTFNRGGNPEVSTVGGIKSVTFDGDDDFISDFNVPSGITGNESFTVATYIYNPSIGDQETYLSTSRRGGGCGTNGQFNYGSNITWGALGHWCTGNDMGFDGGVPTAGAWQHIAVTYAGGSNAPERVYVNGVLNATENKTLNLHANELFHIASARASSAGGSTLYFSGSIASMLVFDEELDATQIQAIYTHQTNAASVSVTTRQPIVNLSAENLSLGQLSTWSNNGTLGGTFSGNGDPEVSTIGGMKAVTFDGNDDFISDFTAPSGITGNESFTISTYIYNPSFQTQENYASWSRRGGPCGTNAQFIYSENTSWGAVGHWCGSTDMGYDGGIPPAGAWQHIAVTYTGGTNGEERVYVNGVLNATENKTLSIHANELLHVGSARSSTGTSEFYLSGSIASLQIYDEALKASEIQALHGTQGSPSQLSFIPAYIVPTTSQEGVYQLIVTNGNGCTDETTVNLLHDEPIVSASTIQSTCTGTTSNDNGALQLTSVTNGDAYHWSIGSTFNDNGGTDTYTNATSLSGASYPLQIATGLANPSGTQDYTIRIYNGNNDCYTDVVVTLNEQSCTGCIGGSTVTTIFDADFENTSGDNNWTFNTGATDGNWLIGTPTPYLTNGTQMEIAAYEGTQNLLTGSIDNQDVDGGPTSAISPNFILSSNAIAIDVSFQYYFAHYTNGGAEDYLTIQLRRASDNSTLQTLVSETGAATSRDAAWTALNASLLSHAGETVYLYVEAADPGTGGKVEAAIDAIQIDATTNTATADVTVTQPTCTGSIANSNGILQLNSTSNADAYHWSVGSTFNDNGGVDTYANATSLSGASYPLSIATGLSNPTGSQDYTIRLYNGSNACYTEVVVTMNEQTCSSCTGNADGVEPATSGVDYSTGNSSAVLGAPDNNYAELYALADVLVLDLSDIIQAGETYSITWRRKTSYSPGPAADMIIEESADGINWTTNSSQPSTTQQTFITTNVVAEVATRYLRITMETNSNDDFDLDAISYTNVDCGSCANPTVAAGSVQPTCTGTTANSDGYLQLTYVANGDRYHWSTGSTFNDNSGAAIYTNATNLSGASYPLQIATGLSNPTGSQDYTVRVYNGSNDCYTDLVVTMNERDCSSTSSSCTNPTVSANATQATCTGSTANDDGVLRLSSVSSGDRYHWSTGNTFNDNGGADTYANATSLSGASYPLQIATGLSNPTGSQDYTIRVYNGANSCYTDIVATLNEQNCSFDCACTEYIYLNEPDAEAVHKVEILPNGTLSEVFGGANNDKFWYPGDNASELSSPHGFAVDVNGYLYIGETQESVSNIRRLTCDGEIRPTSEFAIANTGWKQNTFSIGNTLYNNSNLGPTKWDLCTGQQLGQLCLGDMLGNTMAVNQDNVFRDGEVRTWGLTYNEVTNTIYVTSRLFVDLYSGGNKKLIDEKEKRHNVWAFTPE
ncbi:MAG: SdrD B-like domain-containing protein, partial [Bacteroidota bacterium]